MHQASARDRQGPIATEQRDAELARTDEDLRREIAGRRQAEEMLWASRERHRLLIEDLPFGVFRLAPGNDGGFLMANRAMLRMFDFTCHGNLLRSRIADIFEDAEDWTSLREQLMAEERVIAAEARLCKADGTPMWGGITVSVILDESGDVAHINGLIEDITERKLLETQLAQAQKLEAMGQLAAGIAHEINTPIQYVGDNTRFVQDSCQSLIALLETYQRLLAKADVGEELLDAFRTAAEEADLEYLAEEIPTAVQQSLEGVGRVTEIVRAMKEFSHPDTDEKSPTDINKTIESTVTLARNEWKYVAEMAMDFDTDLPLVPLLLGDIKQVILNILVNASHAIADTIAEPGADKGTITIATRRVDPWAEIRISDTGGGIPEEARSKIFDLFFTTKAVGRGTGQGLAISRAVVVEKHDGAITFESELGKGTTFIIRLPLEGTPIKEEPGE